MNLFLCYSMVNGCAVDDVTDCRIPPCNCALPPAGPDWLLPNQTKADHIFRHQYIDVCFRLVQLHFVLHHINFVSV